MTKKPHICFSLYKVTGAFPGNSRTSRIILQYYRRDLRSSRVDVMQMRDKLPWAIALFPRAANNTLASTWPFLRHPIDVAVICQDVSLRPSRAYLTPDYLNDALAETRVRAYIVYTHTYEESVCACTRKTRSVLIAPPPPLSLHPPAVYAYLFFFISPPLSLLHIRAHWFPSAVELRHVEITVIAAGAESVGMQALICHAIHK